MLLAAVLVITGSMNVLKIESAEDSIDIDQDGNLKDKQYSDTAQDNRTVACPEHWNGTLPHATMCSHYYRCEDGVEVLLQCKPGFTFDREAAECIPTENNKCKSSLPASKIDGNTNEFCQKQVDGFYPNHTQRCQQYFRCQGGRLVSSHSCQGGESFSFQEQSCQPSHLVSCVRPVCHPEEDDFFWLPGSLCRSYYYCQAGTALAFNCPRGKEFSQDTKDCVTGGQCFEPICTGKPDGNHSDTTHQCERFLQCRGGVLEGVTSCPPGQIHNGRSCLPATLAQCERPEATAVAVEAVNDDCRGYSDGAHVLPSTDCHRYQICQDGKALARFSCPTGRRFNGRYCVARDSVPCSDLCAGKLDGYHADETEGCRKYHFCRGGFTTERRSCPEGSLFSGGMCLPAPLVSCEEPPSPPSNPCLGLPDGFHADYLHGCSQYFYCSGYSAVLRTSCPKQMVWNGKQCVARKDALCQGPEPHKECHGLPTGLYQDKASGCSQYSFCHKGNRTLLACPKGKLFDGEVCVSDAEYVCPSRELATCYNQIDGYRTDEESGCRAYYYCSNGLKTTYVCPSGQMFNGSSCMPPEGYSCPYTTNVCSEKPDGYHPDFTTRCRNYFYCQDKSKLNTLSCGARKVFDGRRCVFTTDPDTVCRTAALQNINDNPDH